MGRFSLWAVTLLVLAWAVAARATGGGVADAVSVAPFTGYRTGLALQDTYTHDELDVDEGASTGLVLRFRQTPDSYVEVYYSRQSTRVVPRAAFTGNPLFDLDVHYLQIGGMRAVGEGPGQPYIIGTLGLAYFDPHGASLRSETRLALGVGAGYRFALARHLELRTELRGLGTLFDTNSALFCTYGRCAIHVQSGVSWQTEFSLGIAVGF